MAFHAVALLKELWDGDMRAGVAGGRRVLLVRLGEEVFAYEDRCAHLGVPMSQGWLKNGALMCSAHHYEYDARTGQGINPRNVCLRKFPVEIEAGVVSVDTDPHADSIPSPRLGRGLG